MKYLIFVRKESRMKFAKFKRKRCKNCKYFREMDCGVMYCAEWGYRYLKLDFIMDRIKLFCFRKEKKQ